MQDTCAKSVALRVVLALLLALALFAAVGCDKEDAGSGSGDASQDEQSAEEPKERPVLPTSWVITVVDDDSYTEGEITYSIALNLTATNPTQGIAGTYTGTATAKTDTVGTVQGLPLNASAIANSSVLEFTLADEAGTADGLAPMTAEEAVYSGAGRVVMAAAGGGTIGAAGGGFSATSGDPVEVRVQGSAVTFNVTIQGHTYTFDGTIAGQ